MFWHIDYNAEMMQIIIFATFFCSIEIVYEACFDCI